MSATANAGGIRILGVMTGTSCDGLDAACIEIDETGWRPLWSSNAPYPKALRDRVLRSQKPGYKQEIQDWLELNRDLGEWYAQTLRKIIGRNGGEGNAPQVIANHGQTIAHFPGSSVTLQMGDPTRIAQATGLTVLSSCLPCASSARRCWVTRRVSPLFRMAAAMPSTRAWDSISTGRFRRSTSMAARDPRGWATTSGPSSSRRRIEQSPHRSGVAS